jgi:hypothetical protein
MPNMTAAPTCTVGPSRPVEAPTSRPSTVRTILPRVTRALISIERCSASALRRAAIACGMPLPWAPSNQVRVIQATSAKPRGVTMSGRYGQRPAAVRNSACASSDALANATAAMPTATAPKMNTERRRQRTGESSAVRVRRQPSLAF